MPGRADGPGARLVCFVSTDTGRTWTQGGVIASDQDQRTDLGDGNIVQGRAGELFAVYRHNHHGPKPDYAVGVSVSHDGGRTWQPHSTVEISRPQGPGPSRGLWSPLLFVTKSGRLQCYFDDEATPFRRGFSGHQWLMMKTYSPVTRRWEVPVTVARAHNPAHLSRDGMPSVVEPKDGVFLCAFESVQTEAPHAGLVRMVTSSDGGQTWSWTTRERAILYEPRDRRYHAFSPALAKLSSGAILALIATNEDRAEPGRSGTPARDLALDIKYVISRDGGRTWEHSATLVYSGTHRNYLPGVVRLPGEPGNHLLASFLDFDRGCYTKVGVIGRKAK